MSLQAHTSAASTKRFEYNPQYVPQAKGFGFDVVPENTLDGFGKLGYVDIASEEQIEVERQALIHRNKDHISFKTGANKTESLLEHCWQREFRQEAEEENKLQSELTWLGSRRDGRTAFVSLMDYVHECQNFHKVGDVPVFQRQFIKQFGDQIPYYRTKLDRNLKKKTKKR